MIQSAASANEWKAFSIYGSKELPPVQEVGLKGLNLMRMAKIGLSVPEGFTIGARAFVEANSEEELPLALVQVIHDQLVNIEKATGFSFGGRRPLLLSVRSSAAVSMPGMMATVPNVGMCDSTANDMTRMTGNPGAVWDCYRRLIHSYAEVIRSYSGRKFEEISLRYQESEKAERVEDLSAMSMKSLVRDYLKAFEEETGSPFPQNPTSQLLESVKAVLRSWQSPKASAYRTLQNIGGPEGTAVIIQRMVYGNMGPTSGSGVAFTRDPATGEKRLYLDFLFNAQGDDVVSGARSLQSAEKFGMVMPRSFAELSSVGSRLELEFKDMQDIEFTIQEGRLFVLQCRDGKRTSWAAVKIAVDLVLEGIIDPKNALARLGRLNLDSVEKKTVVPSPGSQPVAKGIAAGPGVAVGEVALDSERAKRRTELGAKVILVRDTISTADVSGIAVSVGVLTALGGRTSHAALLAREMDKVCVVGCSNLSFASNDDRTIRLGTKLVREGESISIDGNTGDIYVGSVGVSSEKPREIEILRTWKKEQIQDNGPAP